jgi:hypothetical protein
VADPQSGYVEILENCGEAADVVLMSVRQSYHVDVLESARP